MSQNKPNWVVIIVLSAIIFLVIRLYNNSSPNPDPGPSDWAKVESVSEEAILTYAKLLSDDMERLADMVDEGKIKSSADMKDQARKLTEASRNKAFRDVGTYDNQYIPAKIEDPKTTSNYLRAKARGHEKAAR